MYFCKRNEQNIIIPVRRFIVFLYLILVFNFSDAQISIDNRQAAFDSLTNSFLVTIPRSCFGNDIEMKIDTDENVSMCFIDNDMVDNNIYKFEHIEAGKKYRVRLIHIDGSVTSANLYFTFLPIITLKGHFGYNYTEATFSISYPDTPYSDSLPAHIKWRGGSTNLPNKHKRNYKVKFDEDHKFFGLRNDNKWLLDAGQPDVFRLRNHIATELWNDFAAKPYYADIQPNARSGVRGQVTEMFINNEYVGIYVLTEVLDRKQMKLKKYEPTTQAIHGCLWKAQGYGASTMYNVTENYDNQSPTWDAFEIKYPELDDIDTIDYSTLYNAINFVVNSSDDDFVNHVDEYFDMPVMTDYYIFLNVLNALDNRGKNTYWAVYDKQTDKKVTLAVWDLDCTVGQRWATKYDENYAKPELILGDGINLFARLMRLEDSQFVKDVCKRYIQLNKNILSADSLKNRYIKYYDLLTASGAAQRETLKWNYDDDIDNEEINFDKEIDYICRWIDTHMECLSLRLQFLGIDDNMTRNIHQNDSTCYNISGQKMSSSHSLRKGIYIRDGRKYIVR